MWQCLDYDELGSTNDKALELAEKATGGKYAVTAARQTNGRGRRGRSWIGMDGNLFLSLAFPFPAEKSAALVLMSSLALLEAVKQLTPSAAVVLKWPNDVLLNGAKISGILLEKGADGYMVVGIGVNVRAAPAGSVIYPVTSLAAAGIETDRQAFKEIYLRQFDGLMDFYAKEGMAALVSEWLRHAAGVGKKISVRLPKTIKEGIFSGLDEEGRLILQTVTGAEIISAGDVFFKDDESE